MDLVAFGPNIWIAEGPRVAAFGPLMLPTRMIVVRLEDGSLWINSPIDISVPEMDQVTELGHVGHLVAPTSLHAWRLPAWKRHFPNAIVWGPPGAKSNRKIALDGILEQRAPQAWAGQIDQTLFEGNLFLAEVEFFHRASRTLMMTDFLQSYPWLPGRPLLNALTRLFHVQGGGVPLDIRLSMVNRSLARRSAETILAWDFDKLIVAHGDCASHDAKPLVRDAFSWLI